MTGVTTTLGAIRVAPTLDVVVWIRETLRKPTLQ